MTSTNDDRHADGAGTVPDIPAYLTLLWHGEDDAAQRPGPKRGVDLREVAAAGIRLADAGGLAAVSMRAVAAELGFTPMALYRYVAGKDELVSVMVDEAYGPAPSDVLDAGAGWRRQIAAWARANQKAMNRHRWILQVTFTEPPLTPNQIGWMEHGLSAFTGTRLDPQSALSCMLLVDVYVRGQAQLVQGMNADADTREADRLYAARLAELADPVQFPHITAALTIGALSDEAGITDEFEFGLQTVLDGIAARIDRR